MSMMLNLTERGSESIISLECDLKDGTEEDALSTLRLKCQVNIYRMCTKNSSMFKSEAEGAERVWELDFNPL